MILLDAHNVERYDRDEWEKGRCPLLAGFKVTHGPRAGCRIARKGLEDLLDQEVSFAQCYDLEALAQRIGVPLAQVEDALWREGEAWFENNPQRNPSSQIAKSVQAARKNADRWIGAEDFVRWVDNNRPDQFMHRLGVVAFRSSDWTAFFASEKKAKTADKAFERWKSSWGYPSGFLVRWESLNEPEAEDLESALFRTEYHATADFYLVRIAGLKDRVESALARRDEVSGLVSQVTGEGRVHARSASVPDAAISLGVRPQVIHDWITQEGLPHRISREKAFVDVEEVEDWIAERGAKAHAPVAEAARGRVPIAEARPFLLQVRKELRINDKYYAELLGTSHSNLKVWLGLGGRWRDLRAIPATAVERAAALRGTMKPRALRTSRLQKITREEVERAWAEGAGNVKSAAKALGVSLEVFHTLVEHREAAVDTRRLVDKVTKRQLEGLYDKHRGVRAAMARELGVTPEYVGMLLRSTGISSARGSTARPESLTPERVTEILSEAIRTSTPPNIAAQEAGFSRGSVLLKAARRFDLIGLYEEAKARGARRPRKDKGVRRKNPPRFLVKSPAQGLKTIQHPEITANFKKALRWKPKHKEAVLVPCAGTKPFPESPSHKSGYLKALEDKQADLWVVSEPLGVVPYEWSYDFPQADYDFPPQFLTGPGHDLLAERIATWIEKVGSKYKRVTLALPGHHMKLVKKALAMAKKKPKKIVYAGIGDCLDSGACPEGHYRSTTNAYRGFLKRRANPIKAFFGEDRDPVNVLGPAYPGHVKDWHARFTGDDRQVYTLRASELYNKRDQQWWTPEPPLQPHELGPQGFGRRGLSRRAANPQLPSIPREALTPALIPRHEFVPPHDLTFEALATGQAPLVYLPEGVQERPAVSDAFYALLTSPPRQGLQSPQAWESLMAYADRSRVGVFAVDRRGEQWAVLGVEFDPGGRTGQLRVRHQGRYARQGDLMIDLHDAYSFMIPTLVYKPARGQNPPGGVSYQVLRDIDDCFTVEANMPGRGLVGFLRVSGNYERAPDGRLVARVGSIQVDEDLRRKGVATGLYQTAADAVSEEDMYLASGAHGQQSDPAVRFWEKQVAKGRADVLTLPYHFPPGAEVDRYVLRESPPKSLANPRKRRRR